MTALSESLNHLRQMAGVLVHEWRRYQRWLSADDLSWLHVCNRNEQLLGTADGPGLECLWRWTSPLHAPRFFPKLGARLYARAIAAYPLRLAEAGACPAASETPDVSFIVGHRGADRLPALLTCLKSIAAQIDTAMECVVVEQSVTSEIRDALPPWVRYVHQPPVPPDAPYNRARVFNTGKEVARGEVLAFHDGDMLVPISYARDLLQRRREGFEVINLKRFIFYLGSDASTDLIARGTVPARAVPESVLQNATGGGSLAVARDAYDRIGGHDESFVGWGGEDVDFWDRARTLRLYPFAHLPFIHLWHPPQVGKTPAKDAAGMARLRQIEGIPVRERIEELRTRRRLRT
jgi:glycosyl transferase family 7 (putative galactosyltransferase)